MRVVIQHAFGSGGRCGHYFESSGGRLLLVMEHPPAGADMETWAVSILEDIWGEGYVVDWVKSQVVLTLTDGDTAATLAV